MKARPVLDDELFFYQFYCGTNVPIDLVIRLRRLYATELGLINIRPTDRVEDIYEDLDFADFLSAVEDHFDVQLDTEAILKEDGSFDSLARHLASKALGKKKGTGDRRNG